MIVNTLLENFDLSASIQWYLSHLDAGYLLLTSHQGKVFTQEDWLSTLLVLLNMLILLFLTHLLIREHKQKNTPSEDMGNHPPRQRTVHRTKRKPVQTKLEAKISDSPNLKQAYTLHRLAMYDHALNKFKIAFHANPHELNTYLVGLKIVSEMDEHNNTFVGFVKDSIAKLRESHPDIWKEVARYGREAVPSLDSWQTA